MQARFGPVTLKPKAIVIMGGLSMPNVPVKAEQVKAVTDKHRRCSGHRGLFYAYVRESRVAEYHIFDCLIDANIDPVEVTTNK